MARDPLAPYTHLAAPAPLLDPSAHVDQALAVEILDPQRCLLTHASGARTILTPTVPLPGALRLVLRDAEAPADPRPRPWSTAPAAGAVTLTAHDGGVRLSGPGVDAVLGADGTVTWGPLAGAAAVPTFRGSVPLGGRLVRAGRPAGWLYGTALGPYDAVLGGGETTGPLDLRGRHRWLRNSETAGSQCLDLTYLNVPWFWSPAGWSLLLVTGGVVSADIGASAATAAVFAVEDDTLDLVLSVGSPAQLVERHTALTGRPGAVPDWALGVWMSRCSYLDEAELHDVLDELHAAGCPVDVLHVNCWTRGNAAHGGWTMSWEPDRDRFPAGWVARAHARGARVSVWHNPFVAPGAEADALHAQGLLVRDPTGAPAVATGGVRRHLVDFTSPQAVAWWTERVHHLLRTEGVDALKTDFGEEVPADAVLADGRRGWQLRNGYSLLYQQTTAAALASFQETTEGAAGQTRVLFTRSGTTGAQRHPVHWVGDQPSTWEGFESAVRSTLSLSASAFGLVGSDVGGFWRPSAQGWKAFPLAQVADLRDLVGQQVFDADVEPELFARWTQWAAFTGVLRFHGIGRREPTAYPEPYRTVALRACQERATLLPYLRSLVQECSATGMPLVRPMPLVHPDAPEAATADLQHLLGPDLLVAALVRAGGRGRVWFPPGRWRAYDGGAEVPGPGWHDVTREDLTLPVWRRVS